MAKPRVFISSTYYDLKHLRSSLENFVESLGFEPILSEKGSIAYSHDVPLDESCYREVRTADIFVMLIGGRYGSEKSETRGEISKGFFENYDSVTKEEYRTAIEKDIPIYILVEKFVYADYETYLRNKDNESISYAHVDSVNVFRLIEDILSQPRNNPIHQFDRYAEIESWLREQWSGYFRELLNRTSSQKQLATLGSQVNELAEVTKTLKTYLEELVKKTVPQESDEIIKAETERLRGSLEDVRFQNHPMAKYLVTTFRISFEAVKQAVREAKTTDDFIEILKEKGADDSVDLMRVKRLLRHSESAFDDFNELRELLELPVIVQEEVPMKLDTQSIKRSTRARAVPQKYAKSVPTKKKKSDE